MNTTKQGNIPFSWENKPGVRKDGQKNLDGEEWVVVVQNNSSTKEGKLPPPPSEKSNKAIFHDIGLPLPPCAFQPPLRSNSRRSKDLRSSSRRSKDDDPFLMAYKECTKSNKKGNLMRSNSFLGSCKHSCSVRDDSIVKVSHISSSNSDQKRFEGVKNQG